MFKREVWSEIRSQIQQNNSGTGQKKMLMYIMRENNNKGEEYLKVEIIKNKKIEKKDECSKVRFSLVCILNI